MSDIIKTNENSKKVENDPQEDGSLGTNKAKDDTKILSVKDLKTYFYTEEGIVKAVDGVSFDINEDEVLGLVGETGCGKSVTALSVVGLIRQPGEVIEGSVHYKGVDLLKLSPEEMRSKRGKNITMIFQDPLNSLNPVFTIGRQISEVFLLHQQEELKEKLEVRIKERDAAMHEISELKHQLKAQKSFMDPDQKEASKNRISILKKKWNKKPDIKSIALEESEKIIEDVGIADAKAILSRYPHELSGGMRQRVMIAMGLSCNPKLLIADEPTTALDVTIQAQILDLMKKLKEQYKTSILLITHDLGVVSEICDKVAVMYSGYIVEYAPVEKLFSKPLHPYTKGLIDAIPKMSNKFERLHTIRGMVPNLIYPPDGCRFHPRCDERMEVCDKSRPHLTEVEPDHYVACYLFDEQHKNSPKYKWSQEELQSTKSI